MKNSLAVFCATVCTFFFSCTKKPVIVPLAHFGACEGQVSRSNNRGGAPEAGVPGLSLYAGNIVATGADGHAQIVFVNGTLVELDPESTLLIDPFGGELAEVGAALLSGTMQAEGDSSLNIKTPFGKARLTPGSKTRIDAAHGVSVLVGDVQVAFADGHEQHAASGQGITIDGLTVQVGDLGIPGLTLAVAAPASQVVSEPVVVLGDPRQVQIRRAGQALWLPIKKRDTLAPGTTMRTRAASTTTLELGSGSSLGTLTLGRASTLTLREITGAAVAYDLLAGEADIRVGKTADPVFAHHLTAGGAVLTLTPGQRDASVSVRARAIDHAAVSVRAGRAELPNEVQLEAGTSAVVDQGHASPAAPLADTQVDLGPRPSAVFFHGRAPPPLALAWPKHDGDAAYEVEIARDREFHDLVFQERLKGNRLVLDDLPAGKYHWRVKRGEAWEENAFSISRGSADGCASCKRTNIVEDTGEKTVVYFQEVVPEITLRWKEVEGASRYRLKLFADGDFDHPLTSTDSRETQFVLRSDKVAEGRYYWLVIALDDSGAELAKSPRMNSLELAYDNAISDLAIKSPADGTQTGAASIVTSGDARVGARLWVNGRAFEVDGKGRFSGDVSLSKGSNTLVYRVLIGDGGDRYYFRTVHRR